MTDAWEIITGAKTLLLDFDGPITTLMPPPLNAQAAERARAALDGLAIPDEIRFTTDHIAVLRFAAARYPESFLAVERACSYAEIDCARISVPSPEVGLFLSGAERRCAPVGIVSNNSKDAVGTFLQRFNWESSVRTLACRTPEVGWRLKPDPFLIQRALEALQVAARESVFVGDSVADVQAGKAAGVRVVGLAKNLARGTSLLAAGAVAVLERRPADPGRLD